MASRAIGIATSAAKSLRPGLAEREHLHIDAGGVHVAKALVTEIGNLFDDVVADVFAAARDPEVAKCTALGVLTQKRGDEVLFDRDDARRLLGGEIVGHGRIPDAVCRIG